MAWTDLLGSLRAVVAALLGRTLVAATVLDGLERESWNDWTD